MKRRPLSPRQLSFSSYKYAQKKRVTRREKFLAEMEQVVPWSRLQALIEPAYPPSGRVRRPPIGVERMLWMYLLQQWFGLADEAVEDAIYDSQSMREFVGIDLVVESLPDAATLLKFRRLRAGTLVDATIIEAPPSTKNADKARDPEMHQTKKGKEWHFGMKAYTGVDAESGLVHSLHTTAANESDVVHAHQVLHGQEAQVYLDAGYTGVAKREEVLKARAEGGIRKDVQWRSSGGRSPRWPREK